MSKTVPATPTWTAIHALYSQGNVVEVMRRLKALAATGNCDALAEVAHLYEIGGPGLDRDPAAAREWYERSARECNDSQAYLALGRLYWAGIGVDQDYNKALELFEKCANKERGALFALGLMHHLGQGTPIDLEAARRCYRAASAQGHLIAMKHLGLVEIRTGRKLAGLYHFAIGVIRSLWVYFRNADDPRLRVA